MSSGEDTVIAVKEERARFGDVEVAKKTVIAATDEGVVAFEVTTVEQTDRHHSQTSTVPGNPPQGALPAPSRIVIADPPERDCRYYCCACDSEHKWYSLKGKGIFWILLLLLMYLIGGAIAIPLAILLILCVLILINEDLQEGMRRAGNQQYIY